MGKLDHQAITVDSVVADLVVVDFHQAAEDFQVAVALDKETPIQTPMQAVQLAEEEVVQVLLDPVEKAQVLQ